MDTITTPGQGAAADLKTVVSNIMSHPNVAPFISRRLILSLVTSNPTPGYIQRIAAVFAEDGNGNVGNLQAVVTAILLDPEARAGDDPANTSTHRAVEEPILYTVGILRSLQASLLPELLVKPAGDDDFGPWAAEDISAVDLRLQCMGQDVLYSHSVFNFYQFNHQLSGSTTFAPEMQIETSSTVIARANFFDELLYSRLNFIQLNTS